MITIGSVGVVDVYRGKTRIYHGAPSAALLAAASAMIGTAADRDGAYDLRWPKVTATATTTVSKPAVVTGEINAGVSLP
jgi:hypothetical protein